jgi:hypothetical protein
MINGYALCPLLSFVRGYDLVGPEPRSVRWSARGEVSSCCSRRAARDQNSPSVNRLAEQIGLPGVLVAALTGTTLLLVAA